MIKTYEKFRIPDENKEKEILVEVNWNPKDDKSNDCKLLRVTFPNGDVAVVKKDHLNALLFAIGNPEEQRKMIPQTLRRSRWYETVIEVEAKQDIKKGEKISFPLKLTLPTFEEEVIAEAKKETANKLERGVVEL